jgi:hypothetical protein
MTLTLNPVYDFYAFQSFWGGFDKCLNVFLFLSSVAMVFLFVSDSQQVSQPISEWRPYKIFLVMLPIVMFLLLVMFVPFAAPSLALPLAQPFMDFITWFRGVLGLSYGYEAGLGMAMALLIASVFGLVAHNYYTRNKRHVEHE